MWKFMNIVIGMIAWSNIYYEDSSLHLTWIYVFMTASLWSLLKNADGDQQPNPYLATKEPQSRSRLCRPVLQDSTALTSSLGLTVTASINSIQELLMQMQIKSLPCSGVRSCVHGGMFGFFLIIGTESRQMQIVLKDLHHGARLFCISIISIWKCPISCFHLREVTNDLPFHAWNFDGWSYSFAHTYQLLAISSWSMSSKTAVITCDNNII